MWFKLRDLVLRLHCIRCVQCVLFTQFMITHMLFTHIFLFACQKPKNAFCLHKTVIKLISKEVIVFISFEK